MTDQISTEQPTSEFDVENFNIDDYSSDSDDINQDALKELMGETVDQLPKLDHDKSTLGSDDVVEELLSESDEQEAETQDATKDVDGTESEIIEVDYNGKSYKIPSELKDALLRQSDYTKKTQELSGKFSDLEKLVEQRESEYDAKIKEAESFSAQYKANLDEHEQFSYAVQVIQAQDPDFFEEMQDKFKEAISLYRNPMIDRVQKELQELKAQKLVSEDSETIAKFYTDWGEASSKYVPQLKELGIEVDQAKVKEYWAKGLSVKQAINALYADKLQKVRESRLLKEKAMQAVKKSKKPAMNGRSKQIVSSTKTTKYGDITKGFLNF